MLERIANSLSVFLEWYVLAIIAWSFFKNLVIRYHVYSFDSIQNHLNGDRVISPSGRNGRLLRQLLVNRQGLVQAALVRWLDRRVVLDQRQERTLRSISKHLVYNSLPDPDWHPLHHSTNNDREQVLVCRDI